MLQGLEGKNDSHVAERCFQIGQGKSVVLERSAASLVSGQTSMTFVEDSALDFWV